MIELGKRALRISEINYERVRDERILQRFSKIDEHQTENDVKMKGKRT